MAITKCDIHRWERYELRDEYDDLFYVGYHCSWCGEEGYALDMEESTRDPFNAVRGIVTGLFIGIALWAVIIAAWSVLHG